MHEVEIQLAGNTLRFESGRIARQASGAVLARTGDDVVLATVVAQNEPRSGVDFLPLVVDYREKLAAAGRIPGSFNRREGRINDHEVLISRIIDRTLRSLFPSEYRCEVQLQVSVLSADPLADTVSLAILAATAALHCSPVPAAGPAAGLRIVRVNGRWLPFPSLRQRQEADIDFIVSAGPDGLVMVEGEADQVSDADVVTALATAQDWLTRVARSAEQLRQQLGIEKLPAPAATALPTLPDAIAVDLTRALQQASKAKRRTATDAVCRDHLAGVAEADRQLHQKALHALRARLVRKRILDQGLRIDGRGAGDIRAIWGEVGWLPRPHGSAIFSRGETQALVSCTLGTGDDAQRIESLGGYREERFLLHYNFPPYSVGEVRPLRGPGRREIGHGMLARRGLSRMLPSFDDFPYTIRVESEISESNGSSSMATVCGGTLALLDAGVPLRAPVAGIAMGLVTDGERTAVLSDILGDEDHLGDMDFKVVGTATGITALQLDNKVGGLRSEQLAAALDQATTGRQHILEQMAKVIAAPAAEPSRHAPRVDKIAIMPSSLGKLVGPRGANIRAIEATSGARVTVGDAGIVLIYADGPGAARVARRMVQEAAGVLHAGHYYRAVITAVKDFGAFARVNQVNEGLIPREEIADGPADQAPEAVAVGDDVVVLVLGVDARGRLRLSRRQGLGVDESQIEF